MSRDTKLYACKTLGGEVLNFGPFVDCCPSLIFTFPAERQYTRARAHTAHVSRPSANGSSAIRARSRTTSRSVTTHPTVRSHFAPSSLRTAIYREKGRSARARRSMRDDYNIYIVAVVIRNAVVSHGAVAATRTSGASGPTLSPRLHTDTPRLRSGTPCTLSSRVRLQRHRCVLCTQTYPSSKT